MLPVHQFGFWAVKQIGLADKSVGQYFYLMSVPSKVILDEGRQTLKTCVNTVCLQCKEIGSCLPFIQIVQHEANEHYTQAPVV